MAEDNQEESELREVPASEILAKIKRGETVEYDHVIIKGNIDISEIDLPKRHIDRTDFEKGDLELSEDLFFVDTTIKFSNSRFHDPTKFRNILFNNEVSFTNCEFERYIHFVGSQFKRAANFDNSKFDSFADFTGTFFNGGATYLHVVFNDRVDFVGSRSIHSLFVGTKFNNDALLMRSKFGAWSQFNGAEFQHADFMEAEFGDNTLFKRTHFFGIISFLGSIFLGRVEFDESEFKDSVDFIEVNFMGYTNFDNCIFDKVANFGSSFLSDNSKLSLKYSSFDKLFIPWKNIKCKLIFDGSAYLALVKNYNNQGRFNDADDCYYQYRIKRSPRLSGFNRILDFLLFYFYGYGVRPKYPLIVMATLFFMSILVYTLDGQASTLISAVELSIITLFAQIPNGLTGFSRWWSIMERILGWLLMSSFLVVLAKKTLR
jgi:uncharacterized protein YjbI with pentapeptide repeats